MLAASVSFDRICTNILTNLINSWTGKNQKQYSKLCQDFYFL